MAVVPRLSNRVATAFYKNFTQMKEAQQAAVVPLLTGRNVVISSGTGSGKTEAAVAPLVDRYWNEAMQTEWPVPAVHCSLLKRSPMTLERRLAGPLRELDLRVGVRHGDRDDLDSNSAAKCTDYNPRVA